MPATDDYLRSPKLMHRVFCASAVSLLFATMWMMYADYNDEWRTYQRQAFKYQAERIRSRKSEESSNPVRLQKIDEVRERIQVAEQSLVTKQSEVDSLSLAAKKATEAAANHLRDLKVERAKRDVARANYNLAIRDNFQGAELESRTSAYKASDETVQRKEREYAELKLAVDRSRAQLNEVTELRDAAVKDLKSEETAINLLHAALNKIEPENAFSRFKRNLMLLPIIDGFNSPERITQDWLPKLEISLGGMGDVSRFDRCRTCHAMIDTVDETNTVRIAGAFPHGKSDNGKKTSDDKFPHPYSSHPRLDVYLGATSPHPLPKFGCTVCHEGQGSGTSFQNASHTPNHPAQMKDWAASSKDGGHNWFDNHFWERPMNPKRFEQSSCIKCHINVVELATNPKFGPTAPKVARGHELVATYGCFGCHEIQGYEGTKIIGPDLRLEPSAEEAAAIAKDPNQVAGKMRKVGPSLRHLALKSEPGFVAAWTEEPKKFRPSTRMPQFFKLDNQLDAHGQKFNPVEIAAMTHYLLTKSTSYDTLPVTPNYVPNAERGKEFFATKGCVNCHSHEAITGLNMSFGPELSRVHAKLKPGKTGFEWLYTWIREPSRYHPRTKMPAQPLEAEVVAGSVVDPAADISAFLLKLDGRPEDYRPTADFPAPVVDESTLDELVSYFLGKVLTVSQIDAFMKTATYPIPAERIKGDEIELLGPKSEQLDPMEWKNRKLSYLGRKSITRYGCYGCHDIPHFEQARPIGTALQDWGKKDRSRLAFEHIHEYLHDHGHTNFGVSVEELTDESAARLKLEAPSGVRVTKVHGKATSFFKLDDVITSVDGAQIRNLDEYRGTLDRVVVGSEVALEVNRKGTKELVKLKADSSLLNRVEDGIGRELRNEFANSSEQDRENSAAFYVESLLHHGRPGFLWQKLRQPRSYDYKMVETKPYDDRLRMPKFPFTEQDLDAIATFVLGLVAEPPATEYLYNPSGAAGARIKGEKIIEQFNCSGCHMLELPQIRYAADLEQLQATDTSAEYPEAIALLKKLRPLKNAVTGESKAVTTDDGIKTLPLVQFHGMVLHAPDENDPDYSVQSWDSIKVGEKELLPLEKFFFSKAQLDQITPARGGKYAEWLVKKLMGGKTDDPKAFDLSWQKSPPPLYKEGTKVQTPWLFNFLKNPGKIRHTTVLRMPRFVMSDDEAQTLANYFAAVDGEEFPYQLIEQREPVYLDSMDTDFKARFSDKKHDYLGESWKMLNGELCIKCHAVGGRHPVGSNPETDIRGPNLDLTAERLKPEWLQLWLFQPKWITPYTSMPAPLAKQKPGEAPRYQDLFGGDGYRQTVSLRDALVNYHKMLEREGKTADTVKATPNVGGGQ